MKITRNPPELAVKELLAASRLPTADITPEHMENYFGAWSGMTLEGVVGVELYGAVALMRSLAVAAAAQRSGLGTRLLAQIEHHAAQRGVHSLFLLTTTAESYFRKHGYSIVARTEVPEAIRNTTEFSCLCPATSALMVKQLQPHER